MTQKSRGIISFTLLMILFISACSTTKNTQTRTIQQTYRPVDKALYDTIIYQDSILFNAFNSQNFERFKKFFAENLEIYQDNTGLRNYEQSLEAFKELFKMNNVLTRQLVKGSVEIYPIKNYGAIETGQHTFCHTENGKPDCGTFKFVHIWEMQNGQWKICRIITYDHKL
ncbi:MAG: nuclear transport factor 2 family protein [Chitinophagales bacterium]